MRAFLFRPVITRPTRTDRNGTQSVIDHIWVNSTTTVTGGIFHSDITDHLPIFCRLNFPTIIKNKVTKIQFRNKSKENKQKFYDILKTINWTNIITETTDINILTTKLLSLLDTHYNACFPIMTKQIGTKRLNKPWLTKAILKSINTKHELYKKVRSNTYDNNNYKHYCNTLNSLLKKSKSMYYNQQFENHKQDLKRTWALINSAIRPGNKHSPITKLSYNNVNITEPTRLAETFNDHFTGIGTKLKNALPQTNTNSFYKYLPSLNINSIFFIPKHPS